MKTPQNRDSARQCAPQTAARPPADLTQPSGPRDMHACMTDRQLRAPDRCDGVRMRGARFMLTQFPRRYTYLLTYRPAFDSIRQGGPTRTSADVSVPRLAGFPLITPDHCLKVGSRLQVRSPARRGCLGCLRSAPRPALAPQTRTPAPGMPYGSNDGYGRQQLRDRPSTTLTDVGRRHMSGSSMSTLLSQGDVVQRGPSPTRHTAPGHAPPAVARPPSTRPPRKACTRRCSCRKGRAARSSARSNRRTRPSASCASSCGPPPGAARPTTWGCSASSWRRSSAS